LTTITAPVDVEFRSDITVQLHTAVANDLTVVHAARVSTLGEQAETRANPERDQGLINYLMRSRHGSPFEHSLMTFRVHAPIVVWREQMRHRMASYNEESARYRVLGPVFYLPARDRNLVQVGKPGHYQFVPGTDEQYELVVDAIRTVGTIAYGKYQAQLAGGIAPEVARMVLPVNTYSSAYVTMNARALMNFLSLRTTSPDARYPSSPLHEIEMVAEQFEQHFAQLMPWTHAAFVRHGRVAP
jgi:thymidylate synthase (FAD)